MKIYLLTIGEYEDECPVGIFSSIEQLEKFKNKVPSSDYNNYIKEFELDYIPDVPDGKMVYYVHHDCWGNIKSYETDVSHINSINKIYGDDKYATYVWASSEKEAIEVAKKIYEENK